MCLRTALMHGRIRSCSNLTRIVILLLWPDVRRIRFLKQDSFGEILCTIGNIIKKRDMRGG